MKKIILVLFSIFIVSFSFAQVEKIRIDKYVGSTVTHYTNRTYENSQTDTTEYVSFANCDSVHYYISTSDSVHVLFKYLYGDNIKSDVVGSVYSDSLTSTTTGFTGIPFVKFTAVAGCGIGSKLILYFQVTGNSAYSGATYSVFVRKFKK
jgi:hypothetical protein